MKMSGIKPTPDRLAFVAFLERTGLNVSAVAEAAGVSRSGLHDWLKGRNESLTVRTANKLRAAYAELGNDIFTNSLSVRTIPLVGRVAAGEHVIMYGHSDVRQVPAAPGLKSDLEYEVLEVDGFSMPPALPGWLVYYAIEPVDLHKVINQPCVVRLDDGRLLFKVVRRYGDAPDLFSLYSWSPSVPPIEPVRIIEARPFAALTPKP